MPHQNSTAGEAGLQLLVSSKRGSHRANHGILDLSSAEEQRTISQHLPPGYKPSHRMSPLRKEISTTEQQNIDGNREQSKADPSSKRHRSPGGDQGVAIKTIGLLLPGLLLIDPRQWFEKQPRTLNNRKGEGFDMFWVSSGCLQAFPKQPHESPRATDVDDCHRDLCPQGQLTKHH